MKSYVAILILVSALSLGTGTSHARPSMPLSGINDLRWQNRIVLIWGLDAASVTPLFQQSRRAVEERDIVWFLMGDTVLSNYDGAISPYFVEALLSDLPSLNDISEPDRPRVVLVGKDGGIKLDVPALDLDLLFSRIDAMPMRMQEMRSAEAELILP